jgi:hypothetical protein
MSPGSEGGRGWEVIEREAIENEKEAGSLKTSSTGPSDRLGSISSKIGIASHVLSIMFLQRMGAEAAHYQRTSHSNPGFV